MSRLPSAPRAATRPNVDTSRLPKNPPYTVFLGNLSYEVNEEDIERFFSINNLAVGVHLIHVYMYVLLMYCECVRGVGGGMCEEMTVMLVFLACPFVRCGCIGYGEFMSGYWRKVCLGENSWKRG